MIKKLFFYPLIFFTLLLFGTGSFYTYNVYYLKKPIIVKGFDDKIQKLIKQFVKEKSSFSGYNIQVNKSIIQIDKFPSLLKIRLIDIKIEDNKSILTSNLEDLSINLSIQDIFNIIFTNKNLSINKLEIDNIKLSASVEKNGLIPGPVISFFIKQMNSKHRGNLINFKKNQFKINDVSLIIKDKTNFFKERSVIFKCKDLTFLKFTETINNLNLKCNKSELARFEINIKNTEENKIILEGSIKRESSDIYFVVTDYENSINVVYEGIVPDLFKEDSGVVVLGFLDGETFIAEEVLAKHDENYMPPSIKINNDS